MNNLENKDFKKLKSEKKNDNEWLRILRGGRMKKWKGKVERYEKNVEKEIGWEF